MASEHEAQECIITEEDLAERFEEILEDLRAKHQTALIARNSIVTARLVPLYDGQTSSELSDQGC